MWYLFVLLTLDVFFLFFVFCSYCLTQYQHQLGEILPDDTEEHRKLVLYVLRFFADPNPHVRYSAIHVIGQFSVDLAPQMQVSVVVSSRAT